MKIVTREKECNIRGHRGIIHSKAAALYAARMAHTEEIQDVGRGSPKINLRLPPNMRNEIEKASKAEKRSVNTEILLRLAQSLEREHEAQVTVSRTNLGLIEFLAGCVNELALMLSEEQRADTKVQLMLELCRSLERKDEEKK